MKILFLIIKKLHGHLVENKLISVIYILSFMVSVLVFTYIYNNFMPSVVRLTGTDSMDHFYKFYFAREDDEEEDSDSSWLRSFLEKYDTYYVEYEYSLLKNIENIENSESESESAGDSENAILVDETTGESFAVSPTDNGYEAAMPSIVAYKDDKVMTSLTEGRLEFTSEEKQGNLNVAILPANSSLGGFPSKYTYEECEYEAIGWHAAENMIIPEELFFNKGFNIDIVTIYLNNTLTAEENKEFVQTICAHYEVEKVVSPDIMDDLYIKNSRQIAFMIIIGFSVMIFVFGYLIRYILIAGKNENVIYRLVGAGNGEIITITMLEGLIINIILSVLTVMIHALLFNKIFNKLNFYKDLSLGISDYLFIVGVTTVFSFVAILPHIIGSVRHTLVKNKR